MNAISLRNSKTRVLIAALLGVALLASVLFIGAGASYADGWEKIFKFKDGRNTYVGALSYKGTYEKGKRVRGILGVKSADSKITLPGKVQGLSVKVVSLYGDTHYNWDGVNLKTKTSNLKSINLKNVTELISFSLGDSKVTKLDFSKNKKLKSISLDDNKKLKSLDLSKNTKLDSISITGAKNLKSINLSKNKKLRYITLDKGIKVKGLSDSKYKKINWV
jgi:Leucine-rich repeat (LRR) protein